MLRMVSELLDPAVPAASAPLASSFHGPVHSPFVPVRRGGSFMTLRDTASVFNFVTLSLCFLLVSASAMSCSLPPQCLASLHSLFNLAKDPNTQQSICSCSHDRLTAQWSLHVPMCSFVFDLGNVAT